MIVTEPTLLLDEDICRKNISRMASKARDNGLTFKPHMKTHQSKKIGEWLREDNVEAITVSSLKMAKYFAEAGWENITIAFPTNVTQVREINDLAEQTNLTLLINNKSAIRILDQSLTSRVNAYIEIDTGSHRSGIPPADIDAISELADAMDKTDSINWIGFYSHPGHSYSARSKEDILKIHQAVLKQLQGLRNNFEHRSDEFEICIGDTPCCSVGANFKGVDAISPGNFIFYDLMQSQIGSCNIEDIAVAVACPVVDIYPERNEFIIYGGAIHFSKESLVIEGEKAFGIAVERKNGKWHRLLPQMQIKALSQEHGTVKVSGKVNNIDVGDVISFLPVHSCLTANLLGEYRLVGKETVMKQMPLFRNI